MPTAYRVLALFGVVSVFSTLSTYAAPNWASIILAAVSFVGLAIILLASAILGFTRWKKSSRVWMLPAVACAALMLVAWYVPAVGRNLADRQFKRNLTEYEEVVAEIRNAKNFLSPDLSVVKTKHQVQGVRAIKATRCGDGALVVAFLLDINVPLIHEGYVYKGYQENNLCLEEKSKPENNWPYVRPVVGNWFHFSDQPGL